MWGENNNLGQDEQSPNSLWQRFQPGRNTSAGGDPISGVGGGSLPASQPAGLFPTLGPLCRGVDLLPAVCCSSTPLHGWLEKLEKRCWLTPSPQGGASVQPVPWSGRSVPPMQGYIHLPGGAHSFACTMRRHRGGWAEKQRAAPDATPRRTPRSTTPSHPLTRFAPTPQRVDSGFFLYSNGLFSLVSQSVEGESAKLSSGSPPLQRMGGWTPWVVKKALVGY